MQETCLRIKPYRFARAHAIVRKKRIHKRKQGIYVVKRRSSGAFLEGKTVFLRHNQPVEYRKIGVPCLTFLSLSYPPDNETGKLLK